MPTKNTIKTYVEDGYYHAYNRGVEKRKIFMDKQDYAVFLHFLKMYLTPPSELLSMFENQRIRIRKTFDEEIELLAFCLMPNHFHLLLRQTELTSMTEFLRGLLTSYSMYFNKKYERVGSLFQGIYKAAFVSKDDYLLQLSKYIHRNPQEIMAGFNPAKKLEEYEYSSYPYYLGKKKAKWVNTDFVLSYFKSNKDFYGVSSYKEFVEETDPLPDKIEHLTLE